MPTRANVRVRSSVVLSKMSISPLERDKVQHKASGASDPLGLYERGAAHCTLSAVPPPGVKYLPRRSRGQNDCIGARATRGVV